MTGSLTGLSPKGPNKYLGPNVHTVSVVTRNRAPTTADYLQPETGKYYPFASLWLVGKNPTTGTYGDIWYLSNITSNMGNWVQFSSGSSGPLLNVVVPNGISPVQPNGSGQMTYTSTGGTIAITGSTPNTINFDLAGGSVAADTFAGDTGTAVPTALGLVNLLGQDVAGSGIQTSATLNTVSFRMKSPFFGGFVFSNNVAAQPISLQAQNQDTDVASNALIQTLVHSASGADPFYSASISGGQTFSWGIDNSDSDRFKISSSTTLGTQDCLVIYPDGNTFIPLGNLSVSRSFPGQTVSIQTENSSNTAGSNAYNELRVAGSSGGNAWTGWLISGGQGYAAGIDNSDDNFKITNSNTFTGVGNVLQQLTNAGSISFPSAGFSQNGVVYVTDANGTLGTSAGPGTWTPTLTFGGASTGITYSVQTGDYVQVGKMCYISAAIHLTNKGSATGNAGISGLPFTSLMNGNGIMVLQVIQNLTLDANYTYSGFTPSTGTTTGTFVECGPSVNQQILNDTNFANTTQIQFFGVYRTT